MAWTALLAASWLFASAAPPATDLGLTTEWVSLPAGVFLMGSESGRPDERPIHRVAVDAFSIARTETTVEQYRACVLAQVCTPPLLVWDAVSDYGATYNWGAPGREHHPINGVSWREAALFCSWSGARLPSEAEWEWAARGPGSRTWPWGEEAVDGRSPRRANLADEAARRVQPEWSIVGGYDDGWPGTAPVGSFPDGATPQAVHDLAGNVWEWVADRYTPDYASPAPPARVSQRVARGGSFISTPAMARSATRYAVHADLALDGVGFRCARDADAVGPVRGRADRRP